MGGFAITPELNLLWRVPYSQTIQEQLVTANNPTGTLTNSDLELAAMVTGGILTAQHTLCPHPTILLASDNTPAVAWATKGSTTSHSTNAYLLHTLASQRRARPFQLNVCYTPGLTNLIADCCSRLFSLSDTEFLHHMNTTFPAKPCWTLVHPAPDLLSAVNYSLLKRLQPLGSHTADKTQTTTHGQYGCLIFGITPTVCSLVIYQMLMLVA
jgi:hypothetical protein